MELPPWLDEAFLATVLEADKDKIPRSIVHKFSVLPAVAAGNNYTSKLYRVNIYHSIEGQEEELSTTLIVKAPVTKGVMNDIKDTFNVYSIETRMYREMLPKFEEKINEDFGPKQFYCSVKEVLVFSDLTKEGYIMVDKFEQFDFAHCSFALKKLAKFHATSVACHKEDPLLVEEIGTERIYVNNEFYEQEMKPWMLKSIEVVADVLSELEDNESVEFILSKSSTIADSIVSFCKPKDKGLNVLNHGDFWMNNMMFKHNATGNIVDMKIIDFQILRYGSPALDLIYFLWSSASKDVRDCRLQELLRIYLQTLNDSLEQLGMKERLTYKELEEDLRAGESMAVLTVCTALPYMLCLPEDAVDMEEVKMEDMRAEVLDEKYLKMYNGGHFKAILPGLIRHLRNWIQSLTQNCSE